MTINEEVSSSLLMSEIPADVKLAAVCKTENINYVGLSNGHLLVEDVQEKTTASFTVSAVF